MQRDFRREVEVCSDDVRSECSDIESQHIENRNHQIEEVARAFGIPRPLLMMDDTSWGSGIEQLAIFFIQHALLSWFKHRVERSKDVLAVLVVQLQRGPG